MTWKEWGMYRQYVIGGGLIRDWLEQVSLVFYSFTYFVHQYCHASYRSNRHYVVFI